jgi:hypothetical protein
MGPAGDVRCLFSDERDGMVEHPRGDVDGGMAGRAADSNGISLPARVPTLIAGEIH